MKCWKINRTQPLNLWKIHFLLDFKVLASKTKQNNKKICMSWFWVAKVILFIIIFHFLYQYGMSSPVGMWSKTVMINNLAQRFCICCELCTIDSMTVTWRYFSGNVSQGYEIYFKHVFRRKTSPPSRLHSFTLQFVQKLEICAWESTIARFIISHNYHSCVNTLEMTWSLEAFFSNHGSRSCEHPWL